MRGATPSVLSAVALLAGCATQPNDMGIRAIADPLAKASAPGGSLIAEAKGLVAIGNIGLAIEAYRKALRQQPDNIEAYAGLAECYDRMGRHDLSRANYEAALAFAPTNAILLQTFAASLERQGKRDEARALRLEAEKADAADATALAQSAVEALPAEKLSPPPGVAVAVATPQPVEPAIGSITVKLPEARPAAPTKPATAVSAVTPTVEALNPGPRLERLSLAEVALVTTARPQWKTELVRRTASSTTVRFVPLADLRRGATVRLLNAARHEGLAARTRVALNRQGWARVTVGDAARVRDKSLILYSVDTAVAARRLAGELKLAIAKDPRPGPITILLGRDAVRRPAKA